MNHPTLDQLKRGIVIAEKIAALEKELTAIMGGKAPSSSPAAKPASAPATRKRGKMSAAGRASIIAAQKARWASIRAAAKAPAAPNSANGKTAQSPAKKKRSMSPEVKARLAAAMKARWAAAKAGKGPAPTASAKK